MKKSEIAPPINPETEVTREGIAKMAGCSLCKVGFVTIRKKWGFPEAARKGPNGILLYCRSAVEAWLKTNDLKNMVFIAEDRAPVRDHEKTVKGPSSAELAILKVGIKATRFTGHGKKITVHVRGHHNYPEPRQHPSRYSNSGAEHQISVSF